MNKAIFTGCAFAAAIATVSAQPVFAEFPEKPIEVVVPFAPGGAGDIFARVFVNTINENNYLSQPMVVVNKPGGGTTIGSGEVKNATADGYTILQLHQTLITSHLMGTSKYGPEAFEPIAETHHVCLAYATTPETGISSLADIKAQTSAEPGSIKEATLIGSLVHFSSEMMNQAGDLGIKPVNVGGGAKRSASLLGGHTDTMITMPFAIAKPDSGFQGVAFLGAERHPSLPDVPTAKEQGIDVEACVNYWWFAPAGTPDEVVDKLAEAFAKAAADEAVMSDMAKRGITIEVYSGEELKARIADIVADYEAVAASMPN